MNPDRPSGSTFLPAAGRFGQGRKANRRRAGEGRLLCSELDGANDRRLLADSRGSLCSPKAGFGKIRLLPRRAAYGLKQDDIIMPHDSGMISAYPFREATMRKLEISDAEVMQVAIRQEIARSEESRYDHRLHGLLLVTKGESARSVAELFDEDARTVQRWVQRFEARGFEGLRRRASWASACARFAPMAACGGRASPLPTRVRTRGQSVGRQALGRTPEKASRRALGGAPVPAAVRATRVSTAQAPSASGPSRSAEGCGGKKNCAASQSATTLSCGTWTNATSSSTARAPGCGWPRRSATRCCCMRPRASRWLASGR